ncbi:glutathione S-transferase family protein [uncultured Tateyamaria sp.]|uniref:glutathione S-transferase family protein n=1 Tax=Tateyamaria sp. 1078 TaxID=3417464 RepID=UPI0026135643|nr:glutathione S-transferase family protein [uncultured Tateyamaria sp.]
MAYVLHYAPDNASIIVRMTLEELGVPYRTALVDRAAQAQASAAYRAINPAGLIPALETPEGTLFETAAILLWLTETHRAMAPQPGDADRAAFLKWLFFTSNTVHAHLRMLFYPAKYVGPDPDAQANLRAQITRHSAPDMTLPKGLDLLDRYIADHPEHAAPSVLHYYIAAILRWCGIYPEGQTVWFDITRWPALHSMAEALETRAAVHAVQAAEGLGPTPFTAPRRPNPPEGIAL